MFPIYSPSSQCISHNTTLSVFPFYFFKLKKFNGTNGKILAKQKQYKMKGKGEGNTQPAKPRNVV
jgi:hypothetical protein